MTQKDRVSRRSSAPGTGSLSGATDPPPSGPIIQAATSAVVLIRALQKGIGDVTFAEVRKMAKSAIDEFRTIADQRDCAEQDVELAAYALTAAIDELAMRSAWPGRTQWLADPLNREMYHSINAGVEFFEKLTSIRTSPGANPDLLELFSWCILGGFRGKYRGRDLELNALLTDHLDELSRRRKDQKITFAPHALVSEPPPSGPSRIPIWIILAFFAVANLVGFFAIRSYADEHAREIEQRINSSKMR